MNLFWGLIFNSKKIMIYRPWFPKKHTCSSSVQHEGVKLVFVPRSSPLLLILTCQQPTVRKAAQLSSKKAAIPAPETHMYTFLNALLTKIKTHEEGQYHDPT